MQDSRIVHVTFGSAHESLCEAIAEAGWPEEVVHTHDPFAIGPIAAGPITAPMMVARAQALNDILGVDEWEMTVADNAPLLAASLAEDVRPVVWFSRRDTQSYAGFLWWLSHRGDVPCDIVDLTESILPPRQVRGKAAPAYLAISPSLVPPAYLIHLRREARPLLPEERLRYRRMWLSLVRENAALRVIEGDDLVSAPITYFDGLLLSCVVPQWWKMALVIGEAMMKTFNQGHLQVGDLLLHTRLRALVTAGMIEAVGDPARMQACEVRLPGEMGG